ncbi:MAG: XdhC family protein, partial [Armatimonadota bacterium]|nr:XdhC family protein [Armatimonadota bacterium]
MSSVEEAILDPEWLEKGACLATVVSTTGSVPMSQRARMLVCRDGRSAGTVGGGRLEASVQAAACEVIAEGKPRLVRHILSKREAGESGLVCGGTVELFLEPLTREMVHIAAELAATRVKGGRAVLAVVLEAAEGEALSGDRLVVGEDGRCHGTLGDAKLRDLLC